MTTKSFQKDIQTATSSNFCVMGSARSGKTSSVFPIAWNNPSFTRKIAIVRDEDNFDEIGCDYTHRIPVSRISEIEGIISDKDSYSIFVGINIFDNKPERQKAILDLAQALEGITEPVLLLLDNAEFYLDKTIWEKIENNYKITAGLFVQSSSFFGAEGFDIPEDFSFIFLRMVDMKSIDFMMQKIGFGQRFGLWDDLRSNNRYYTVDHSGWVDSGYIRPPEESTLRYRVYTDDIAMGTISDAEYNEFKLSEMRNPRNYLAQFLNVLDMAVNAFCEILVGIPTIFFFIMIALVYIDPAIYTKIIAMITTPEGIKKYINEYLVFTLTIINFSVAAFVVFSMMSKRNGFVNMFDFAVGERIKTHLKITDNSQVKLEPYLFDGLSRKENSYLNEIWRP